LFDLQSVRVVVDVPEQPASDAATVLGADQRARKAFQDFPDAEYWVGVEGGIEDLTNEMAVFAWIVVLSKDAEGRLRTGKARTGTFFLPLPVADLVREGKELGLADDIVFGRSNSKQENGAVGILTGDVVDRALLYEQGVILALIPFKNPGLY
jgi:inosine/xanthosine triphosphatase